MMETPLSIELGLLAKEVESNPRLSRSETMSVLRRCYAVGLIPLTEAEKEYILRTLMLTRAQEGANRVFTFKRNPYSLVLRYVFRSIKERSNVSRYAVVLNHMASVDVKPEEFMQYLSDNGGLVTIYYNVRNKVKATITRSILRLDKQITRTVGVPFTLHLVADAAGVFTVLDNAEDVIIQSHPHKTVDVTTSEMRYTQGHLGASVPCYENT